VPFGASGFVAIPALGTARIASVGRRFAARVIDLILYVVVVGVLMAIAFTGVSTSTRTVCDSTGTCHDVTDFHGLGGVLVAGLVSVLIGFLYEWLFIAFLGQTLGKMALGVKVIRADDGRDPGLGRAFVRQVIPAAASIICGLLGLFMYISVFFDTTGRNQTWYDKAANDFVINVR
jgi:uncharacterized RDD family membrane protein YckC